MTETLIAAGQGMNWELIGQIAGWVQVAVCLFTFISNKRSRILILKLVCDVFSMINSAFTGFRAAAVFINVCLIGREAVFFNRTRHKWADHKAWLFLFMFLAVLTPAADFAVRGSFTFLSLLPAAGTLITTAALFDKNTLRIKTLMIVAHIPYLFYHALVPGEGGGAVWSLNLPGFIGSAIPIVSAVIGIANEFRAKKKDWEGAEGKEA